MANSPLAQRIPAMINGISRQSPTIRHATQVEEAENITFSVIDGIAKRSGTRYINQISDGERTFEYRMHRIERDETLEFVVVYGPGVFEVVSLTDGVKQTLTTTTAASDYINSFGPTADELRLVTVADTTFVANTLQTPRTLGDGETVDKHRMPVLLTRASDGTWTLDVTDWNERPWHYQVMSPNGTATSGQFKLKYRTRNTGWIDYDASAEDVEEELDSLSSVGDGKVQAFGGPANKYDIVILFSPDLDVDSLITVSNNSTNAGYTIKRGSDETNPVTRIIRDELPIRDISYYRNRLILAGDEFIAMSQVDDLFNFYADDATVVTDSDPIEVGLAANDVTIVSHIVPHRDGLIINTQAGQQFQLQGSDILSPSTAAITPTTRYETQPNIRPVAMGSLLYLAGQHRGYSIMYEYQYDDANVTYRAEDVTKHVFDLIPPNMVSMRTSPNNDTVLILPRNDINETANEFVSGGTGDWDAAASWEDGTPYDTPQPWDNVTISSGDTITFTGYDDVTGQDKSNLPPSNIYVYRRYEKNRQLMQSAWSKWSFGEAAEADNIMDIVVVDNELFIMTRDDTQDTDNEGTYLQFWKTTLTDERQADTNFDYEVLLDHQHSGFPDATTTSTNHTITLVGIRDESIDTVVLSQDWTGESGSVLAASASAPGRDTDITFTTEGPHTTSGSDHAVIVGRSYDGEVTLSTVFQRGEDGVPMTDGRVTLRKVVVDHHNAGPYDIVITDTGDTGRVERTVPFSPATGSHSETFGTTTAWVNGESTEREIKIRVDEPKPCTISAIEYHGHYSNIMEA